MKGLTFCVSMAAILIFVLGPAPSAAIYNNICRLFADGSVLRDPHACNSYITCTNSVEVSKECPKGQLFSVDSKKCVASTASCDDPCAPDYDSNWAADPVSCNGYYYCRNGTGTLGMCPGDLHFDEDGQQCVFASYSECGGDNYCHIVPDGIYFKDETACDKYYACEKRVLKSKSCSSNQLFSTETGKCVATATGSGCDSMPTDVCKNGSKKIHKNIFVADVASCRGYYFCADVGTVADPNPVWGQCSEGQFFSFSSQSCEQPINVACVADRCNGRPDMFVNGGGDCQHYLVCKNGLTTATRQCANYMFFDEIRQGCTAEVIEYTGCAKT